MSQSEDFMPRARSDGIVAEQIDDGVVVYDERTATAHYLSGAAAYVWDCADGQRSAQAIAAELGLAPEMVEQAVAELVQAGLFEEPPAEQGYSRRQAAIRLAQVGGAALAAPLIYSVAVPASAVATASCIGKSAPNCTATISKSGTDTKVCTCSSAANTCYHSGTGFTGCALSGCSTKSALASNITKCCCSSLSRIGETSCTALAGGTRCPD
jgi:hypothetical protein